MVSFEHCLTESGKNNRLLDLAKIMKILGLENESESCHTSLLIFVYRSTGKLSFQISIVTNCSIGA
jgi:hypothetical protein